MWIDDWEWDEENTEHIARHGLKRANIEQVSLGDPRFFRNKKGRRATHVMIGPDLGGRFFTVFIQPVTDRPGRWRVVTALRASESERKRWTKS